MACNGCNGCNGCDDGGVEFNGYTRSWQPNDTSTGYVGDKYGGLFGSSAWRSSSQHNVNTIGGDRVNIISTPFEELGSTLSEVFGSTLASSG
jgi:hypothetical protein